MTASQPRIQVTEDWTDIAAVNGALASVEILVQNLDDERVDVVFGGASKPTTAGPVRLDELMGFRGTAANVWVRGSGYISATVV